MSTLLQTQGGSSGYNNPPKPDTNFQTSDQLALLQQLLSSTTSTTPSTNVNTGYNNNNRNQGYSNNQSRMDDSSYNTYNNYNDDRYNSSGYNNSRNESRSRPSHRPSNRGPSHNRGGHRSNNSNNYRGGHRGHSSYNNAPRSKYDDKHKRDDKIKRARGTTRKDVRKKDSGYQFGGSGNCYLAPVSSFFDLSKRYYDLYVPSEFSKVNACWIDTLPTHTFPLNDYIKFKIDTENGETTEVKVPPAYDDIEYKVSVVLCTGINPNSKKSVSERISFILNKIDRNIYKAIGGHFDRETDGEPEEDNFIACGIRHVKDQIGLDISGCSAWWRFIEIEYERTDFNEISIYYVVSLNDIVPSREEFLQQWESKERERLSGTNKIADPNEIELDINEETENEDDIHINLEEAPETALEIYSKKEPFKNKKISSISLNSVLNYDRSQNKEYTFEVLLFGEAFREMMQRDFGNIILEHLKDSVDEVGNKRKRDDASTPAVKKQKTDDGTASETNNAIENDPAAKILQAYEFFDKNKQGYLKVGDLEDILHCLGSNLTRIYVRNLISPHISDDKFVYYKKLINPDEN
eukprot:TRINITY_DN1606_c0_g2_i2.p1 TRINITY_DN1606_c0_g2~~TRINITY_DN1606_c0_g2_i2.p1  ORF type:complete len:578 (-),score=140.29 TRINITY_DN1606_c0_g2_i2:36-1769(-)